MPDRLPPYSSLYITRLHTDARPERQSKIDMGSYVATEMVKGNGRVFISGGTTAAIAGLELMLKHPDLKVVTHSIPFAWHVMEFKHRKYLDDNSTVEVVAGHVDAVTGVIAHERLGKLPSEIFIYAPRGLNKGVRESHNRKAIEEAWKSHSTVILLATHLRLLDKGGDLLKHIGKIRQAVHDKKRICELVIPATAPEGLTDAEKEDIKQILLEFERNEVTIHKAPRCIKSKWHDYFRKLDRK